MKLHQIHRHWATSSIAYKLEYARWNFFGYNPVGTKILAAVDRLHARFPESTVAHKLWLFCLPF